MSDNLGASTPSARVRVRAVASPVELAQCVDFLAAQFPGSPMPRDVGFYAKEFALNPALLLLAEVAGQIEGVLLGFVEDDHVLVGGIAISLSLRGQGIGSLLIDELVRHSRLVGQDTILAGAVEGAEGFYQRTGFEATLFVQAQGPGAMGALEAAAAGHRVLWRDESDTWAKMVIETDGVDRTLQRRLEREVPESHTQYLMQRHL